MEKKDDDLPWWFTAFYLVPGTILGIVVGLLMIVGAIWLIKAIWYAV